MSSHLHHLFLAVAALFACSSAFGQVEFRLHARQLPGWDARAPREGRRQIRVCEGSECSQPLPYNSIRDFQVHQAAGCRH